MDFDDCLETRNMGIAVQWVRDVAAAGLDGRITEWMSGFRNGTPCRLVDELKHGSFNWLLPVCYSDGIKVMLRLSKPGITQHRDEKVVREVAVIHHLRYRTSLPVPRIRAWGPSDANPLGFGPFIIMDYVRGTRLSDLWQSQQDSGLIIPNVPEQDLRFVYRQCARYMLDLAKHPFQCIGSPTACSKDQEIEIGPPLTLKMQEIEAHSGVKVCGSRDAVFTSSAEYFRYVLNQNWMRLTLQANSVDDEDDAKAKYTIHKEIEVAVTEFSANKDPARFRLFCDDMAPHNMIVKSATDLTIICFIDWEWSWTAPYQVFSSPPRWLALEWPINFSGDEDIAVYSRLLDLFLDELEKQEHPQQTNTIHANHIVADNGRVPPLPDPTGQKLSSLMRENWDSGRFWFHEIIHASAINGNNMPWKKLTAHYPYLKTLHVADQTDMDTFVKHKLEDLEMYKRQWALTKKEQDEQHARELELSKGSPGQSSQVLRY